MANELLGLIGLCRRAGMLQSGEEPAEAACRAKDARLLLLASDAADNTARRVVHFSEEGDCLSLRIPFTKTELGHAVGRTSCAIAAVTDIGFASAMARRLADGDPGKYAAAAEKLELKEKRAAERKAELKAHEKNLREGRRKPAKAAPPKQPPSPSKVPGTESSFGAPHASGGRRPVRSRAQRPTHPTRPARPFAHSRPVKKGKGSFRKKDGS